MGTITTVLPSYLSYLSHTQAGSIQKQGFAKTHDRQDRAYRYHKSTTCASGHFLAWDKVLLYASRVFRYTSSEFAILSDGAENSLIQQLSYVA